MKEERFKIRVGKITINKTFSSRIEARDWALWNYKGQNNFIVVSAENKKVLCNCHIGNSKTGESIWNCSTHGNCWNGIRALVST